jgi:hypothetical protein
MICLSLVFLTISVNASDDSSTIIKKEIDVNQSNFTNITVFWNDFYITDQGKAVLTSSVDARNVDECKVNMYLQRYKDGKWTTVKNWSSTESGDFCGIGKTWYVLSGYQYRMKTYAYVYLNDELLESTSFTSKTKLY